MLQRLLSKLYKKENGADEADSNGTARVDDLSPVNTAALTSYAEKKEEARQTSAEAAAASAEAGNTVDPEDLKGRITDALRTVYDPEIPVNIYDLGLIYEIQVEESGMAHVRMTLTAPNCPAAGILPSQVESKARSVQGVHDVQLELTFDPPWNPEMMSEAAKLELGFM